MMKISLTSLVPNIARCQPTILTKLIRPSAVGVRGVTTKLHEQRQSETHTPRTLITGSCGQLGQNVAKALRLKYGVDSVVMSDIIRAPKRILDSGPYIYADILDYKNLQEIVVNYQIDWVIHFSALLSAVGETDVPLAIKVNVEGLHNVVELAKQYKLRIFVPSTIGAFGPESPRLPTPDLTVQRPKTIYGVSKVHAELLGEYYHNRFGLDFRCLRFPGVISADTPPGGGTTDYAVQIFHDALTTKKFNCYLREDTLLPMMYIDDLVKAVVRYMSLPPTHMKKRTYNVQAMSFTPDQLVTEIRRHVPDLEVNYEPDYRQAIADTWPQVFEDSNARADWGWSHDYDIRRLTDTMVTKLSDILMTTGAGEETGIREERAHPLKITMERPAEAES